MAALLLLVPLASAATFTQPGNGPLRTGAIDFQGPATNDTAFQLHLPGVPLGLPSVINNSVYVVTIDNAMIGFDGETEGLNETALWRIDLTTAELERVFTPDDGVWPVPVDVRPERAYFFDFNTYEIFAAELPSGEEMWRFKAMADDPRKYRLYGDMVIAGDTIYMGFQVWGHDAPDTPLGSTTVGLYPTTGLMAVDALTGEIRWTRTFSEAGPPVCCMSLAADPDRVYVYLRRGGDLGDISGGLSAAGEYIIPTAYTSQFEIRAYSDTGGFLWNRTDTEQRRVGAYTSRDSFVVGRTQGWGCCAYPAVAETGLFIRLDSFEAINPQTGDSLWTSEAGRSDHIQAQGSNGIGARGETLLTTSTQTVYRLDRLDGDILWQHTQVDQWFAGMPITIDDDTAYIGLSWLGDDCLLDSGMEARDLGTGELKWRWWHTTAVGRDACGWNQRSGDPAFGPGFMVWGDKDGTFTVLGETAASLGGPNVGTEHYPGVDEAFDIDLSHTRSGAFGEATRYRVAWGDGAVSDWQDSPVFSHTYDVAGDVTARLQAANEAGQTASTFVTMHVGGTQPNFVETAFSRQNQDLTFGILGIALALTGGAIGVTRRYRHRSRLQSELVALEEAFEETREQPAECEAQLTERKAHARGLMLDGQLTNEQFRAVEGRATELLRELRLGTVEGQLNFLPYGLVKSAREMLDDGRVSSLEADAFLAAVEADDVLTSQQKAIIRERIEAWHARDQRGGAS